MKNYENYIVIVENEYLSTEVLMVHLQSNQEAFSYLLERNYIKSDGGNAFAFSFVGVISFNEKVICVVPKYYKGVSYSDDQKIFEFATVIKVLKKLGRTNEIPDSNNFSATDYLNLTEFVLADKFLKDYLDYGIYIKNSCGLLLNGDGETNWDVTISGLNPIFTRKRPIYSDAYTSYSIIEECNLITEFHRWVVKYSLQRFGRILDYRFTYVEDCINDVSELGTIEHIKDFIRKELNITYADREILLLKRLLAFLDKIQGHDAESFNLYGTGYFHVIWEKACSSVLNNRVNDFIHLMPSPMWNDDHGNSVVKDTLRPDVISTLEGEESKFFIFDAKYYNLQYSFQGDLIVSGNPGIQDVCKQFLYAEAFKAVPYVKKFNCFLFPNIEPNFFTVIGSVTFCLFDAGQIHNIFISPDFLFKAFLSNSPIGDALLGELAIALF